MAQSFGFAGTDLPQAVVLGDGPAQFYYGFYDNSPNKLDFATPYTCADPPTGILGDIPNTDGIPTPGETFTNKSVNAWFSAPFFNLEGRGRPALNARNSLRPSRPGAHCSFHLAFQTGGETYVGTAHIDPDATLD